MRLPFPSPPLARLPISPLDRVGLCGGVSRWLAAILVAWGLGAGNTGAEPTGPKPARLEKSGNFFQAAGSLPKDVQRVLVLPLTCEKQRPELAAGCEALELIVQAELAKTRKFEVIKASATTLRSHTGRASWSAEEALPPGFFGTLREAYGCDAILFCHLTEFKAYAPLSVGWRLRLVDTRSQQTIWASDEVFDAARAETQAGVRRFERRQNRVALFAKPQDWMALHSPRRFGEFALATVLATLPER